MNRAPGTIWMLRMPPKYPNGYVKTMDDDKITIAYYEQEDDWPGFIYLSRKDARLLAKRINQCLDSTVKK